MASTKIKFVVLSVACVGSMIASGAFAAYDATASVVNKLQLDTVDIALNEYSIIDGEEVPWSNDNYTDLTPGAVVSKIPRITCNGADCYIRAKVELETLPSEQYPEAIPLTMDDVFGIDDTKWTYKDDGYFYYSDIMKLEDTATLFDHVEVPTGWTEPNYDSTYRITVTADAVQSEHFTPDMTSDSPWGDIEIEKTVRDRSFRDLPEDGNTQFIMTYGDGTNELIVKEKDLFSNFKAFVPGDTATDSLDIQNKSNKDIELFFNTQYFDDYELEEDADLLKQIGLTIECRNSDTNELKEIYKGDLMAESLKDYISLGKFEKGFTGELKFTLEVPTSLKNKYNMTQTKVQWNFGLKDIGAPNTNTDKPTGNTEDPHTGANYKVASGAFALISLASLFGLSRLADRKKKKAEE